MKEKLSFGENVVRILFVTVFGVIITGAYVYLSAYTLSKLWEWFIVPMFNLKMYSLGYFMGMSALLSLLTQNSKRNKKVKKEETGEIDWEEFEEYILDIAYVFLVSILTLLFGYIIKTFLL